jgi:hypothetical protein
MTRLTISYCAIPNVENKRLPLNNGKIRGGRGRGRGPKTNSRK